VYCSMRYGGRSFGPFWLGMIDMWIALGNIGAFIFAIIRATKI
jgi:hypothetical protein